MLGEELQQQKFRLRVRGTAHSFLMPWEDILEELLGYCAQPATEAQKLPRSPECLKYVLKVHMRVDRQNMHKVLRQLTVRPFVLILLLDFLIEHNHEVFRNRGTRAQLKAEVREAVGRMYPVTQEEQQKPLEEQVCQLPDDLLDAGEAPLPFVCLYLLFLRTGACISYWGFEHS